MLKINFGYIANLNVRFSDSLISDTDYFAKKHLLYEPLRRRPIK
jgi:hypothetical protein